MARKALSEEKLARFREEFCNVAYQLYQNADYDAISMRGIAKAMGCSPMMAYRYFTNKEAVYGALRERFFNLLGEYLEKVPDDLDPMTYLNEMGKNYVRFAQDHPHAYRLLYVIHRHRITPEQKTEEAQSRSTKVLFYGTRRAVEEGYLKGDPIVISHLYWAALHGLVSLKLSDQLQNADFADLLAPMITAILQPYRCNKKRKIK